LGIKIEEITGEMQIGKVANSKMATLPVLNWQSCRATLCGLMNAPRAC
jgi:hypothetical protein